MGFVTFTSHGSSQFFGCLGGTRQYSYVFFPSYLFFCSLWTIL